MIRRVSSKPALIFPLEDGVNDETVRAIFSLKDPNKIVYTHYSMRSPKEMSQRVDLEIVLTRAR